MTELQYDFINIHTLTDDDIEQTRLIMSPEKQARIDRFSKKDRKLQSIAAELLARRMISARFDIPQNLVRIGIAGNGQPIVLDQPCYISLSHSGHLAMCAVSNCPVGADIEIISDHGARLHKRICTPEEQTYIIEDGVFSSERFYRIWTAKEAVLKRTGIGLAKGLSTVITASADGIFNYIDGVPLVSGIYDNAAYAVHG